MQNNELKQKWLEFTISGNNEGLIELLNEGIDVNIQGDIGNRKNWTALMFASRFSNTTSSLDTVKLLLEHGANVNLKNIDGITALMAAARFSNVDSSIDTVKLLLEHGANVNLRDEFGWSALMFAARHSNNDSSLETVKLLLENGADVNLKDNQGWTVLMIASRYSNNDSSLATVKLLLENGSDVNNISNDGWTALKLAARNSNTESSLDAVKLLLEYGANPFDNIECPTEDCQKIIDEARWKRLYKGDKEIARKYSRNSKDGLPADVWELILLEKRRQQLCSDLKSNKNKGILILFAQELGISITELTTKAQLCGYIASQLVYSKEEKYQNKTKTKLDKNLSSMITLARDLGINIDRPPSEILKDLALMY